jgi:hypothetical protein
MRSMVSALKRFDTKLKALSDAMGLCAVHGTPCLCLCRDHLVWTGTAAEMTEILAFMARLSVDDQTYASGPACRACGHAMWCPVCYDQQMTHATRPKSVLSEAEWVRYYALLSLMQPSAAPTTVTHPGVILYTPEPAPAPVVAAPAPERPVPAAETLAPPVPLPMPCPADDRAATGPPGPLDEDDPEEAALLRELQGLMAKLKGTL